MRKTGAALSLALLAGCMQPTPEQMSFSALSAETRRDYREAFFEVPFSEGGISVLTTEHGELHTYALSPCGQSICGATGRRGTLGRDPDYWIVTGAYRGRTFYLRPGGDGTLRLSNGTEVALAWD